MSPLGHSPITILAIDDEAAMLAHISAILTGAGYCCHSAADGKTAIASVQEATPDLIIADINLAGHSGVAVCEQLKHLSGMDEVPVMFLSSAQVPDIIRRAHAAGGTYYLRKPFDASVLLQLIEKALPVPHLTGA